MITALATEARGALMHFDDRLATVLRNPAGSEAIAHAQYRQLLDLLGTLPSDAQSPTIDKAYLHLGQLAGVIPAAERAAILEEPVVRLRAPRLVAQLALAEPAVARTAAARAELSDEQWLDLIPALPVHARGVVRGRRNLGPAVQELLARLGVAERGLPPVEPATAPAASNAPASAEEILGAETPVDENPQPIEEIGAIVRRIEAYRKNRQLSEPEGTGEDAGLPLGDAALRAVSAFDFATDAEGRIVWADPTVAPAAVGLRLTTRDPDSPVQGSPELLTAFRHRQPIAQAGVSVAGAPAVSGDWLIDAAPRFDQAGGRFVGYLGRLRRPVPGLAPAGDGEGDRMRQILHELRTPVNAIQGFAEVIQQQLFGPTPHEYRALAATIASDSARMLAGFEELERLVKLDGGAMLLEPGECDLLPILTATARQLEAYNTPRRSGLALACEDATLPVAMDQAEAERLVWRLFATLAGATAPGEVLDLRAHRHNNGSGVIVLTLQLPASLAVNDDETLFHTAPGAQPHALTAGMFGTGFALRLAAAEAKAAGGALSRQEAKLHLSLPTPGA